MSSLSDFFATLSFAEPLRFLLLLLIPALVAAYVWASRSKKRRGMRFTNTSMLAVVVPKQSQWRRHLAVAFSLLSLVTLTAAVAAPTADVKVARERATVVIVLDASQSMAATDVKPNRLDAAKKAADAFALSLPEKYNVAVVSMAGSAQVLLPPSLDHQAAVRAIDSIKLQDSTAVGEGIEAALRALSQAPKGDDDKPAPGAIVLLSDGQTNTGRAPAQAAADAKAQKVPIYTIAYGTENGFVDLDGKRQPVPVDKEELQSVSDKGAAGGQAYDAASADDLSDVYKKIGSDVGYEPAKRDVSGVAAGYGLVFAVLAALGAISLGAKWP